MTPIGYIRSPYQEKFAIPRQPGLVPAASGYCDLIGEFGQPETVRGLEQFSHIWVLFEFHAHRDRDWQPLVRPPRLGGNKKVGVFASRSTFRPNSIGMSLLQLEQVSHCQVDGKAVNRLTVCGLDLLDGTPILDIKPYLPYAESLPQADAGYAEDKPTTRLSVCWQQAAKQQLHLLKQTQRDLPQLNLEQLIEQVLQQDPRPAYQAGQLSERRYGVKLAGLDVQFCFVEPGQVEVVALTVSD
ncbi:tRNA (N6-threonylcarbamoyladenosine(37)-N6)-methyltransferase TrmO [Neiella marina]|uniref:tRNA (N6-threonylcarbamoyladenosine(37)-N6)-methyltransferase TrmO n=1 Tax=Neiella holothuriorum TaxID=2870530 RepID=A0ABS7EDX3_9GAMM|nr:tRNA (N6-threonylcarbamoyladenosine(37)-N6)-methyltransferase TrmO [Neiella holothuriorum]MBW8190445.1 tRNA (N6-threonylcarbamoyladenosine(37)-N6)-methyltransferase TrmO [Neiella holothuriorum]